MIQESAYHQNQRVDKRWTKAELLRKTGKNPIKPRQMCLHQALDGAIRIVYTLPLARDRFDTPLLMLRCSSVSHLGLIEQLNLDDKN